MPTDLLASALRGHASAVRTRTLTPTSSPYVPLNPPHAPGLDSRIGNHIEFPDYSADELTTIGEVIIRRELDP